MKLHASPLALVVETHVLVPARFDDYAFGPLVLVRPGTSLGLLEHELMHVRQFWRTCGLYGLLTWCSLHWRQRFEVEAYRAQLAVAGPGQALHFAAALASNYGLALTIEEAYRLLTA